MTPCSKFLSPGPHPGHYPNWGPDSSGAHELTSSGGGGGGETHVAAARWGSCHVSAVSIKTRLPVAGVQ